MKKKQKELIDGIKNSDLIAFKEFFDSYYGILLNFTLKYIPDREPARDVVQDSFATFWEQRKKIRSSDSGMSLLFKIIKNNCLNILKREEIKSKYIDHSLVEIKQIELSYTDNTNPVYIQIRENELQQRLDEALGQLPKDRRKIFELSRFNGLKNEEIAKKLGLSVRTVDTQIYRAVKSLKEVLKELI